MVKVFDILLSAKAFSNTVMDSLTIQSKLDLGCVKRFEAFETIGDLMVEVIGETFEFSFVQRIRGLIVEVINVVAGFIACVPFKLIENVINSNNQIKAVEACL